MIVDRVCDSDFAIYVGCVNTSYDRVGFVDWAQGNVQIAVKTVDTLIDLPSFLLAVLESSKTV